MWTKRPTYEEVLGELERDYVVKLPDRVALNFYDSFAMGQFREQQAALNEHGAAADQHRGAAMETAAEENGVSKHEFMQFAKQVHEQSTGANAELQRGLQESAESHRRGLQQQADEFGRQLAEERVRNDQRDQLVRQSMADLANTKRSLQCQFLRLPAWQPSMRQSEKRPSR